MTSDPEIRVGGRLYKASYFEELLTSWTKRRGDRPSRLLELVAAVKETIRRDQEHEGDSLRSNGSTEGHGKGDHSDPTLNAALVGLDGWENDPVHMHAVSMCEHLIEADLHLNAAVASALKAVTYSELPRESLLTSCANTKWCDKTMTGIGEDRPKRGRCDRCYRFYLEHDRDWTPNAVENEGNGEAA